MIPIVGCATADSHGMNAADPPEGDGPGGKADERDPDAPSYWSVEGFDFPRPLVLEEVAIGDTPEGTFDPHVHYGFTFTMDAEFYPAIRLTYWNDPEDGVSPHTVLLFYRRRPDATGEDPRAIWEPIDDSSFGPDDAVDFDTTDPQPAGTYLLVLLSSDYTDREQIGYSVSILTGRELPCARDGVIEQRGTYTGSGTATENGQDWAYYKARDAAENDLEAQFAAIRQSCDNDISVDSASGTITARGLSYFSKGQWVAALGVPTANFRYGYDWSNVEDDDVLEACTEVAPQNTYSRRFECREEATLDWACCTL